MEEVLSFKKALVIHPRFYLYGGGELLCMETCKALQENGYRVLLACDTYDPGMIERMFRHGQTMRNCQHIQLPRFKAMLPRFMAYQRVRYAAHIRKFFNQLDPDLVFSTQSSIYFLSGKPTFHFIYDIEDLELVHFATLARFSDKTPFWKIPYYGVLRKYRDIIEKPSPLRQFLALSRLALKQLQSYGYENSEFLPPPCPNSFKPGEKKKQVVQVTRVVPQKRLSDFKEIARRLPEYKFIIVGRESPIHPGYLERLLEDKPENLFYYETPINEARGLLEESTVYLYTSLEPGIGISLVQGVGAGCVPIVPSTGGGYEVVDEIGFGFSYSSLDEAVIAVKQAMRNGYSPHDISWRAERFSPERFRQRISSFC